MSRSNLRIIHMGGLVPAYGLSELERRELLRVAVVKSFGEDGLMYVRKRQENAS